MAHILNVPGYEGIRLHKGNTAKDSLGCIIVGKNKVIGKVVESKITYDKLFPILEKAYKEGNINGVEIKGKMNRTIRGVYCNQ